MLIWTHKQEIAEVSLSKGRSQYIIGGKQNKIFRHRGDNKKNFTSNCPTTKATLDGAEYQEGAISPTGEKEGSELVPGYPHGVRHSWRNLFLSCSTQSTEAVPLGLGGGRRSEKRKIRISKGIKGTWLFLTLLSRKSTHKPPQPWISLPVSQDPTPRV